jgi:hypothetical protein
MEEINAIQQASPIQINVKVIHSEDRKSVCCDSATISEEACLELARQLNIKSTFGWSLFAECKSEVGFKIFFSKKNSTMILYSENLGLFSWF